MRTRTRIKSKRLNYKAESFKTKLKKQKSVYLVLKVAQRAVWHIHTSHKKNALQFSVSTWTQREQKMTKSMIAHTQCMRCNTILILV